MTALHWANKVNLHQEVKVLRNLIISRPLKGLEIIIPLIANCDLCGTPLNQAAPQWKELYEGQPYATTETPFRLCQVRAQCTGKERRRQKKRVKDEEEGWTGGWGDEGPLLKADGASQLTEQELAERGAWLAVAV